MSLPGAWHWAASDSQPLPHLQSHSWPACRTWTRTSGFHPASTQGVNPHPRKGLPTPSWCQSWALLFCPNRSQTQAREAPAGLPQSLQLAWLPNPHPISGSPSCLQLTSAGFTVGTQASFPSGSAFLEGGIQAGLWETCLYPLGLKTHAEHPG